MTEYRSVTDVNEWWTLDQAAEHLDLKRATVERYIREGLPKYFGTFVKREELLAEYRKRLERQRATRGKPESA